MSFNISWLCPQDFPRRRILIMFNKAFESWKPSSPRFSWRYHRWHGNRFLSISALEEITFRWGRVETWGEGRDILRRGSNWCVLLFPVTKAGHMWPHTGSSFHLLRLVSGCEINVMGFSLWHTLLFWAGGMSRGRGWVGQPHLCPPWERGTKREYITLNLLPKHVMGFEHKYYVGCLSNEEGHRLMGCGDGEKGNIWLAQLNFQSSYLVWWKH